MQCWNAKKKTEQNTIASVKAVIWLFIMWKGKLSLNSYFKHIQEDTSFHKQRCRKIVTQTEMRTFIKYIWRSSANFFAKIAYILGALWCQELTKIKLIVPSGWCYSVNVFPISFRILLYCVFQSCQRRLAVGCDSSLLIIICPSYHCTDTCCDCHDFSSENGCKAASVYAFALLNIVWSCYSSILCFWIIGVPYFASMLLWPDSIPSAISNLKGFWNSNIALFLSECMFN